MKKSMWVAAGALLAAALSAEIGWFWIAGALLTIAFFAYMLAPVLEEMFHGR